jgi:hypothetical protein
MATTYTLISSVTVGSGGASSIDFTSIPATYTDLLLKLSTRTTRTVATDSNKLTVNSASAYSLRFLYGNGSSAASATDTALSDYTNNDAQTSNTFGNSEWYIPNYLSSGNKSVSIDAVTENNATSAITQLAAGLITTSSAITSITIVSYEGFNFKQYSTAYLYGISNA